MLPYSHVDDLTTLMDRLGLETAVLIGHELGAFVARAAAIEKLDRVEALVLAAAGTQGIFGIPVPNEEIERYGRPLAAAHYLHWEQTQEFNLFVLDFLASLDD